MNRPALVSVALLVCQPIFADQLIPGQDISINVPMTIPAGLSFEADFDPAHLVTCLPSLGKAVFQVGGEKILLSVGNFHPQIGRLRSVGHGQVVVINFELETRYEISW